MTREEALSYLVQHPGDVCFCVNTPTIAGYRIVVKGDLNILQEIHDRLGGELLRNWRGNRAGEIELVFRNNKNTRNLTEELADRQDFRISGKLPYATRMLDENN